MGSLNENFPFSENNSFKKSVKIGADKPSELLSPNFNFLGSNTRGKKSKSPEIFTEFLEFWENVCEKWLGIDPKTKKPTKTGGILPRVRHFAVTFEEDGNASLHCHILVWFFVRGSFADNFNKFVQCHQHRKESGFQNPAWRFGFYDSKIFKFEPIPDISRPSKVSKNISAIKQENNFEKR